MAEATTSTERRLRLDTTRIVFLAWIATFVGGAILVALDGGNLLSQANLVKMLTGMSLLGFLAFASFGLRVNRPRFTALEPARVELLESGDFAIVPQFYVT